MSDGQPLVIDSQRMQNRGIEIPNMNRVARNVVPKFEKLIWFSKERQYFLYSYETICSDSLILQETFVDNVFL